MEKTQKRNSKLSAGNGKYVDKKEVADRLGVTVRTVDNWCKKWGMPRYRPGGRVMFVAGEVDRWVKSTRKGGAARAARAGRLVADMAAE